MAGTPGEWMNPRNFLIVFCLLQLLIYAERGAFSSNGINAILKQEFTLTVFQDGLLPAAFMIGLLISSPIFAESAKHARAFTLIAIGLSIWAAAVFSCGLSIGFYSLLLCRMAVGVGEASFVALAAPFIDDVAPPQAKAKWLAIFFLCIPCGFALGYIYGGLIAPNLGWRAAFFIEAALAIPFILLSISTPPTMDLRGTHTPIDAVVQAEQVAEDSRGRHENILTARFKEAGRDVLKLAERPLYLWVVGGMTAYTAVLGTMSYYGPQAATAIFVLSPKSVDLAFGGLIVFTGVVGTLSGGLLLDKWGSTLYNGTFICFLGLSIGAVFIILAFTVTKAFFPFCFLFGLGQCSIFGTMAPGNAVAMWSVPPGLRPLAMSMSVVAMHVLGDVPAPPLVGLLQGRAENWRITMSVLSAVLFIGAGFYFIAAMVAKTAIDFRNVEELEGNRRAVENDGEEEMFFSGDESSRSSHSGTSKVRNGSGGSIGLPSSGRITPEQTLLAEERTP